jgi:hypothetical protein
MESTVEIHFQTIQTALQFQQRYWAVPPALTLFLFRWTLGGR